MTMSKITSLNKGDKVWYHGIEYLIIDIRPYNLDTRTGVSYTVVQLEYLSDAIDMKDVCKLTERLDFAYVDDLTVSGYKLENYGYKYVLTREVV